MHRELTPPRQACTQQGSHSVGQLLAVLARVVDHAVLAGANLVVVARRRFPYAGAVHHEVAPRRICTHDSSTHTSPRGVTALFPRVAARWDREGEDTEGRRRTTADHGRVDPVTTKLVGAPGVLATADLGGRLPHNLREVADHAVGLGGPEGLGPHVVLDLVVPRVHRGTVRCVRGSARGGRPVEVLAV